jgi:hypothetical protein
MIMERRVGVGEEEEYKEDVEGKKGVGRRGEEEGGRAP